MEKIDKLTKQLTEIGCIDPQAVIRSVAYNMLTRRQIEFAERIMDTWSDADLLEAGNVQNTGSNHEKPSNNARLGKRR